MAVRSDTFPQVQATQYSRIRSKLKNGDVLLCSGEGLFSNMIQQATGSIWSHVGFILRLDDVDRVMLLESVEPIGVRTIRLSKYLTGYDEKGKTPYKGGLVILRHKGFDNIVDSQKLKELIRYAVECFGHPYDKDEIVKIAARILASKIPFTQKQKRKIKPDKEFICSEYVARCYEEVGVNVQWNKLGFIAPNDFVKDHNFELVTVLKSK